MCGTGRIQGRMGREIRTGEGIGVERDGIRLDQLGAKELVEYSSRFFRIAGELGEGGRKKRRKGYARKRNRRESSPWPQQGRF